jgi:hypothetical protein
VLKQKYLSLPILFFSLCLGSPAHAIIGGGEVFDSKVVKLMSVDGLELCTGVFVGPRVILSAGHCAGKKSFDYRGKVLTALLISHPSANLDKIDQILQDTGVYPKGVVDLSLGVIDGKIKNTDCEAIQFIAPKLSEKVELFGWG